MRSHVTVQSTLALSAAALLLLLMMATPARSGDPGKKDAGTKPDLKALAAPIAEPDKKLPQDNDYVVHEWGTFTSFSGSDGVSLDFRTTTTEDLPSFVIDRQKQAFLNERRDLAYVRGRNDKGIIISRQRMETPVTYFYTDQERLVDVTVEFPRGLLTEFYPPVRQFAPAFKRGQVEALQDSWLRWGKIRVIPPAQAPNPQTGIDPFIMKVNSGENEHYAYARETDSATIQLNEPAIPATFREKFLFYRGVGNFDLPVTLSNSGQGRFILTHSGKTPLRYAFLVQIDPNTRAPRFAQFRNISGSIDMKLPPQTSTVDDLADQVVAALVSDGLYEKEARAMVKTWRSSWFGEPGTRVLYSLPQADTDALLPLHLNPAPKERVRVMIGRLETLTAEQEHRIAELVSKLGAADPGIREQTAGEIRKLGRFAEPALARVAKVSEDPEIQARAKAMARDVLTGKASDPQQ